MLTSEESLLISLCMAAFLALVSLGLSIWSWAKSRRELRRAREECAGRMAVADAKFDDATRRARGRGDEQS